MADDDWQTWLDEAVAAFRDTVAALPEDERAEALRAGRDALDAVGARLVGPPPPRPAPPPEPFGVA